MTIVYCEHLDDRDEINENGIPSGSDVELVRSGRSSNKELNKKNYAHSNDPISDLLDQVGEITAVSFTCPMCRGLTKVGKAERSPRVYFIHHNLLETEAGLSFARLRYKDGMFTRDRIDEKLGPESMLVAHSDMA